MDADKPAVNGVSPVLQGAQRCLLKRVVGSVSSFLKGDDTSFDLERELRDLVERRQSSYGGEMISVRRSLVASKVVPAWPKVGEAAVCKIIEYIDEDLKSKILNPWECLLPVSEWPTRTPRSKVHASDEDWYKIVQAGAARGMFARVGDHEIFKNQFGELALNGAMGVDKPKEIAGKELMLLRFISILTPINAYTRDIEGDAWSLPQASLLACLTLQDDELFWTDSEDLTSCFNLFALPESWRGFMAFSKKVPMSAFGGASNVDTFVGLTVVPMGVNYQ